MQNFNEISDEALVIKIRSENKEFYAEIVDRYQAKLMRYVRYLIQNEDKSTDVVQETLIKAYVNLNGFNIKKKFSSWIYRIAHNEAINAAKKYQKETSIKDMDFTSDINLEDDLDKKQIIDMAKQCLANIPLKYSESLALFYLEEKSYEEISDILRIPMGTVATRINRAKALMKKICLKIK